MRLSCFHFEGRASWVPRFQTCCLARWNMKKHAHTHTHTYVEICMLGIEKRHQKNEIQIRTCGHSVCLWVSLGLHGMGLLLDAMFVSLCQGSGSESCATPTQAVRGAFEDLDNRKSRSHAEPYAELTSLRCGHVQLYYFAAFRHMLLSLLLLYCLANLGLHEKTSVFSPTWGSVGVYRSQTPTKSF